MASGGHPDWLRPDWDAPGVGGLMTTRAGGVSTGPFESMNVRGGLGDDPVAVLQNQAIFAAAIGARPVWLNQVHGATVVRLTSDALGTVPTADASVCAEPGIACTVQVADCLPVLFAAPRARAVGGAHAGWRGLAGGVLEATLAELCAVAGCEPAEVQAWLGPCIGPRQFEVGADVLRAFGVDPQQGDQPFFAAHTAGKWMADLAGLARERLRRAGVSRLSGGTWCTVEEASRFFSFRRDRSTGRMVAAIWLDRRG
ncbi:MAG: peptidoglycan editing factor PgeF [Piscinibacter sp.]|uniref:peptidoglycan editing factor PgeF n=1 Tax=Piscinibacter sp. TaxID=1903157 RepID=UPI003D0AF5DD